MGRVLGGGRGSFIGGKPRWYGVVHGNKVHMCTAGAATRCTAGRVCMPGLVDYRVRQQGAHGVHGRMPSWVGNRVVSNVAQWQLPTRICGYVSRDTMSAGTVAGDPRNKQVRTIT
jgi:hypothetical protein